MDDENETTTAPAAKQRDSLISYLGEWGGILLVLGAVWGLTATPWWSLLGLGLALVWWANHREPNGRLSGAFAASAAGFRNGWQTGSQGSRRR